MTGAVLEAKIFAAERHVARIRLAVAVLGTAWFAAAGVPPAWRSWCVTILALAWAYTLAVIVFRPYRRWPILLSSVFTTTTDAVFSTLWIGATGGISSVWFLLYYLGLAATAFRYRARETFVAAALYAVSYLLLVSFMGTLAGHLVEIGLRVAFIFLVAWLCGPLASETVEQARQKRESAHAARNAEEAAAKLRGILEGARTPVMMFDAAGRIEFMNAQAQALFELPAAESVAGKSVDVLFARFVDDAPVRAALERARISPTAVETTATLERHGRDRRELLWSASAWHDPSGEARGMIAVCWDETERRQRERDLRSLRIRLEEAERRRIARELHDQVGQILTGLALSIDGAARRGPTDPQALETARTLVDDLISRVRALSLDLRPAVLDDLGLTPAITTLIERFQRQTGIAVEFRQIGVERRFGSDVETAAFRLVQEALTNIARHAGVDRAELRAWADDISLSVQVEDKGRGFNPDSISSRASSGLAGMRERAALLGGQLTIESAPGAGTRVTAELPLDPGVRDEERG